MLKEYGLNYEKRRTNQGMQTNLALGGKQRRLAAEVRRTHREITYLTGNSRSFFTCKAKVNSKVFTVHRVFTTYHNENKQ
jgi:hypothetical protein